MFSGLSLSPSVAVTWAPHFHICYVASEIFHLSRLKIEFVKRAGRYMTDLQSSLVMRFGLRTGKIYMGNTFMEYNQE